MLETVRVAFCLDQLDQLDHAVFDDLRRLRADILHVDRTVHDVGALCVRQLHQELCTEGRRQHRKDIGDRLRVLLEHEATDESRIGILQAIPDRGLVGLEGRAAAQQSVHFFRCQALFENAFDSAGVIHEACTFGEQVLEFIDQLQKLVRRNFAQRLRGCNDCLQLALGKKFQQLASNPLAHRKKDGGGLFSLG